MTQKELEKISLELKVDVINMLEEADSGHVGGAFSVADFITTLFFDHAQLDPQNPNWNERDYILLSNGHVCPILYATLARKGFFAKEELYNLRKIDSLLQGHPNRNIPGVENSSGPLGHGLSQAVGIAYGLKMDKKKNRVFCLTSDGEHQEGQTWEAIMSANKWKLDNLVVNVDRNFIQIEGKTEDIMPIEPLKEKYESFGWTALEIDGHNFRHIKEALSFADKINTPVAIISHTISGEDVSFMEKLYQYHDWKDKPGESTKAIEELNKKIRDLL